MSKHSKKIEFKTITNIGIFNLRLNVWYYTNKLEFEIIKIIENEVICCCKAKHDIRSFYHNLNCFTLANNEILIIEK